MTLSVSNQRLLRCGAGVLCEREVGQNFTVLTGEELLALVTLDEGRNDNVLPRLPFNRRGELVLVTALERLDNAEDLVERTTDSGRVRDQSADGLLRVDDEDGTDGKGESLLVDIGSVLVVKHAVLGSDLALLVADDGVLDGSVSDLINVFDPTVVRVDVVGAQTNDLDVALLELGV